MRSVIKNTLVLIMLLIASSMALNIRKSRSEKVLKQTEADLSLDGESTFEGDANLVVSQDAVVNAARQAFDRADINKTGNLNQDQVEAAIEYFCEASGLKIPSDDIIQEAFERFDADKSGKLDFDEFLNLLNKINDVVQEHMGA
jgi:hypothetical protein